MSNGEDPIIACELRPETRQGIESYAEALRSEAPNIGAHGMSEADFWASGLFRSAIERLRGQNAATMREKRAFMNVVLDRLAEHGQIDSWSYTGAGERHDYEIRMGDGRISVVETKGCLDGNNTNIFSRPPQADEFIIWSLCLNAGADPRKNAWSGIHTRLSAEVIDRNQRVDGLVIWDMVCGTLGRLCPKLSENPERGVVLENGLTVPPPCLYLFPRSIPDPRNNPRPAVWRLSEVSLLQALYQEFNCEPNDVVSVQVEARMQGADLERRTRYSREGVEFRASGWTALRRARR